jgi:hypothetical protein
VSLNSFDKILKISLSRTAFFLIPFAAVLVTSSTHCTKILKEWAQGIVLSLICCLSRGHPGTRRTIARPLPRSSPACFLLRSCYHQSNGAVCFLLHLQAAMPMPSIIHRSVGSCISLASCCVLRKTQVAAWYTPSLRPISRSQELTHFVTSVFFFFAWIRERNRMGN